MNRYIGKIFLACAVCIILSNCAAAKDIASKQVTYVPVGKVVHEPGMFQPDKGKYQAELAVNDLGGFFVLSVTQMGTPIVEEIKDVTGISWITESFLIYSVSPIYGNPGIYILNCLTREIKRIIAPKNINAAYPNGADYFELLRLSTDKMFFFYSADVDSVDFRQFRSPKFLFQANLDGSEVTKAVEEFK